MVVQTFRYLPLPRSLNWRLLGSAQRQRGSGPRWREMEDEEDEVWALCPGADITGQWLCKTLARDVDLIQDRILHLARYIPWVPQFAVMVLVRDVKLSSQIFCVISIRHHYVGHRSPPTLRTKWIFKPLTITQQTADSCTLHRPGSGPSLHRGHLLVVTLKVSQCAVPGEGIINIDSLSRHDIWKLVCNMWLWRSLLKPNCMSCHVWIWSFRASFPITHLGHTYFGHY